LEQAEHLVANDHAQVKLLQFMERLTAPDLFAKACCHTQQMRAEL